MTEIDACLYRNRSFPCWLVFVRGDRKKKRSAAIVSKGELLTKFDKFSFMYTTQVNLVDKKKSIGHLFII